MKKMFMTALLFSCALSVASPAVCIAAAEGQEKAVQESETDVAEGADSESEVTSEESAESDVIYVDENGNELIGFDPSSLQEAGDPVADTPQAVPQSAVEKAHWIKGKERQKSINVDIVDNVTRLEVFYVTQSEAPTIIFTSRNGNKYSTQEDSKDGDFQFVTKTGFKVKDFSGVQYMIIYIVAPKDPGSWVMTSSVADDTDLLVIVESTIPNNWEDLTSDYRTYPLGEPVLWMDNTASGSYVNRIVDIIRPDSEIPIVNQIQTSEPDPVPEKNYTIMVVAIVLAVIVVIVVLILMTRKKNRNAFDERRTESIKKANNKVKNKRAKQENDLEAILESHENDYYDEGDADYSDAEYEDEEGDSDVDIVPMDVQEEEAVQNNDGQMMADQMPIPAGNYQSQNQQAQEQIPMPMQPQTTQQAPVQNNQQMYEANGQMQQPMFQQNMYGQNQFMGQQGAPQMSQQNMQQGNGYAQQGYQAFNQGYGMGMMPQGQMTGTEVSAQQKSVQPQQPTYQPAYGQGYAPQMGYGQAPVYGQMNQMGQAGYGQNAPMQPGMYGGQPAAQNNGAVQEQGQPQANGLPSWMMG